MKKILSAIVSVSVFSSLFSGISLAASEEKSKGYLFESAKNSSQKTISGAKEKSENTKDIPPIKTSNANEAIEPYFLYKNKAEKIAKQKEKQVTEDEKESPGIIKKVISAIFYGLTAKKVVDALDKVGYINSSKFSERAGNILGVLKKGPNPKKMVLAAAKNQGAVKDAFSLAYNIPLFSSIFSVVGKVGTFFGLPDFSKPVGALVGAFVALTNEKTVFETVVENAANYIDDEDESNEKNTGKNEKPENKK